MKFRSFAIRFLQLFTLVNLCLLLCSCDSSWTSQATNIILALEPAIAVVVSLLAAFGAGIPPVALTSIQTWANDATAALASIKTLIDQYTAATAAEQPGILNDIKAAITVLTTNLNAILPELHITNQATQAKIDAIISLVADELTALLNLIPVIQGAVTDHDEVKALVAKLKSAKEFKKEFNAQTETFGPQFVIH
jgi:hypothetical protein